MNKNPKNRFRLSRKAPTVDQFAGLMLRKLREDAKLTPNEVALLLCTTAKEISKLEEGRRRVSASRLFILAKRFDVPVAAFFGWPVEAA